MVRGIHSQVRACLSVPRPMVRISVPVVMMGMTKHTDQSTSDARKRRQNPA